MGSTVLNTLFAPGQTSIDGVSVPYANWVSNLTNRGTCKPTVAQALVQYPQYCGALFGQNENEGTSIYNSFQTKIEKQFSGGIYLRANTPIRVWKPALRPPQATAGYGGTGGVISPFRLSQQNAFNGRRSQFLLPPGRL